MIFGIGVDIIEIERIAKLITKPNLARIFSAVELEYAESKVNKAETLAGCFAAKEAVLKAFGTGFYKIGWCDVEIIHGKSGSPMVNLLGKAACFAEENRITAIHLSVSHDNTQAVAMAVAEKAGD